MISARNRLFIFFLLSLVFTLFSFSPSIYEIYRSKKIPSERAFVLEHNYMFDYNFYLSRIRQGQEGRWTVVEKYYNKPHQGSLFQILYLALGQIGNLLKLDPPFIYHSSRLIFGFILLLFVSCYVEKLFKGWWGLIAFLFIVTAGSWPILIKIGENYRFATYMGWWSAVDSLQRITFIPHVLFGQIFLLLFVWYYGRADSSKSIIDWVVWGMLGLIIGIVFPPTIIVIYTIFGVLSVLELVIGVMPNSTGYRLVPVSFRYPIKILKQVQGENKVIVRFFFVLLSFPSLIYLQMMFRVLPWSALALFDIAHRTGLPYREYALALGPVLPLGLIGSVLALYKREKKLLPAVSWIISTVILILVFEKVPQQSPLRWTEAAVHIPLGIFAAYLFYQIYHLFGHAFKRSHRFVSKATKITVMTVIFFTIIIGLGVMGSMVLWLTDQARWKSEATWPVPIGAQLTYPLKDFMGGVYYLRDNTQKNEVVLAYITAGNFIPAYAGNFVYLGHANTPDEDGKEKIAAEFFLGKMKAEKAKEFLRRENISYIYFGPQEREIGMIEDLLKVYSFLKPLYTNQQVVIYGVE